MFIRVFDLAIIQLQMRRRRRVRHERFSMFLKPSTRGYAPVGAKGEGFHAVGSNEEPSAIRLQTKTPSPFYCATSSCPL
jgi:hypothetical protein